MNKPFRILQVGCGAITNAWFKATADLNDIQYVGLMDLNHEAAQKRREEYHLTGAAIFTDLPSALRETRPDAVFDCTIPAAHTPTALTAFEHGVHVLSEKPMSDTLENAQKALDASRAAGLVYAITQNYRYRSAPRRLRAFLDSGAIGKVTTVNADMFLAPHFGGFRDEMAHVLLLDMSIHTFDMARYLGAADPTSVFCHEWNPSGSWYRHGASASAIFEMQNGVVYNYRGSWCATGLPTGFSSHWRIIGERGTVLWDGGDSFQAEVEDADEGWMRPVRSLEVPEADFGPKADGHAGVIREFLDAIAGGPPHETRAEDNIKSLGMVLGAVRSAGTRSRVDLG